MHLQWIGWEDTTMELEHEMRVYQGNLIDLLQNEGKYVLVCGDKMSGPFETYEAALENGYEQFGLVPFLVKRISKTEPVHYFSRDLRGCQS
jgi:hypothetical protein